MKELFKKVNCNSFFLEVLDNLQEGINIVNRKGIIIYSNIQSAKYVGQTKESMIGFKVTDFYPQAALKVVLETGRKVIYDKVYHDNGQIYSVVAEPIYHNNQLIGGYAIFKDLTDISLLTQKIERLEKKGINADEIFKSIVGWDISLSATILKAKKSIGALGGPRHSLITGESGTGKTMMAASIYEYARKIGVLASDAPFVEVNCAQYTNADIAAMEVFGSTLGAYTGAKNKKGLFELADGGVLFLDEAHALDNYQNLLLKALESGYVRRIGGVEDIKANVIVIAASTKNLRELFVPELYQRLAQYELYLPPLRERTMKEKELLFSRIVDNYKKFARERYEINLEVDFSEEVKQIIFNYNYPRNIRQFRDVINSSIDSAAPLITKDLVNENVFTTVRIENLPHEIKNNDKEIYSNENIDESTVDKVMGNSIKENVYDELRDKHKVEELIRDLSKNNLGPRKIANILSKNGIDIKYYQVAYRLKKIKEES